MATNGFSALLGGANKFTRKWGGNIPGNVVDPYITGYSFIKFGYFPPNIYEMTPETSQTVPTNTLDTPDMIPIIESSVLSVTLPTHTLNSAEFQGLGGVTWGVPTYSTFDNTFTMRFIEFQGLPILNIFSAWVKLIRDYRTGTATFFRGPTIYTKSNYAASIYYWTTLPDGVTVQQASLLTGVYPTKDPIDSYGHDITAIDKLEVDIDFHVDYVWRERWVASNCQQYARAYADNGFAAVNAYGESDGLE